MIGAITAGLFSSGTVAATNSYESIATVSVGAGGTSSIDFTSIPSTYKHLQIRLIARSAVANIQQNLQMRINGDTGSNYSWHQLIGDSQTAYAQSSANTTTITNIATVPGATEGANIFTVAVIDILDYADTNKYKTIRSLNGKEDNTAGTTNGTIALCSGGWRSTSAITSLSIYSGGSANLVQYSQAALYGIKG